VGTVLSEHFYLADGILFEKKCLEHSLPWGDFHQSGVRINWSTQKDVQVEPSGHSVIVAGTPEAPLVSLETRSGI
jgi:coproporphyrinogen III oxidase